MKKFTNCNVSVYFRHCDLALCEIAFYLDCLTFEDGIDRWSRNVSNKLSIHAV